MSGSEPRPPAAPSPVLPAAERARLFEQRLAQVRRATAEAGEGAVLLETRRNFAWLTVGGLNHVVLATENGAAPLIVTQTAAVVLAPVNEAPRLAEEELHGLPVAVEALDWWDADAATGRARQLNGGREPLREARLAQPLLDLRSSLARAEHARLAWLGRLVARSLGETLAGARAGVTEHDLAADALGRLAGAGVRAPVVLAAADGRIERFRHPLPTNARIGRRAMLVLVGEAWGLHVALTGLREIEPPSADLERRMEACRQVLGAMREASRPDSALGDVLEAAQAAYRAAGFAEEWRLHHQGGSIGYQGRERIAVPGDRTPIRAGMALAWNPSIRGAKAEETLYLDEAGRAHVVTTLEEA